jgi:hypothetical protein
MEEEEFLLMNEETKNENTALVGSAFARVLARLMESKLPHPANSASCRAFSSFAGYDPEVFRARLRGVPGAGLVDLTRLAEELELSDHERIMLAYAYT